MRTIRNERYHYVAKSKDKNKELGTQWQNANQITVDLTTFAYRNFEDLVSSKRIFLFERLGLSTTFLGNDYQTWHSQEDFQQPLQLVTALNVVNACAERGISIIQEYFERITKDESQL
jgi:hypothetical protein